MTQKFYLHDAASGDTGSLPGATTISAASPTVTASGASTNRRMDGAKGALQVTVTSTNASSTSAQSAWFRRYISAPLKAGVYASGTWAFHIAGSESNAASNFQASVTVGLWRPGTGALITRIYDHAASTAEPGTGETALSMTFTGAAFTAQAGDILVVEVWRVPLAQGTSTARTSVIYYDGTTEDSTSSNAAYVNAPVDVPLNDVAVVPGVGNLVLTGYAPTVVVGQNVSVVPNVGSLLLAGYAPLVATPSTVMPGVGALALTGFAPIVKTPRVVIPGVGALVLTGYAPTVSVVSGGVVVVPGTGSLVLTGYAPTVKTPRVVVPSTGVLALTGYAPIVKAPRTVVPGAAVLTLTGYAPVVKTPSTAIPATAVLALLGYAPVVATPRTVTPAVGSLILTGYAPTVSVGGGGVVVIPDVGVLVLTGHPPEVVVGVVLEIAPTDHWLDNLHKNSALFSPDVAYDVWPLQAGVYHISPAAVAAGRSLDHDTYAYPDPPPEDSWNARFYGTLSPAKVAAGARGTTRGGLPT